MLSLIVAGGFALLVAALSTPALVRFLQARRIGQPVRSDGPASHWSKAGTPTMGGIVIVGAVVIGFLLGHVGTHVGFSRAGALVVGTVVVYGVIGFLDDYIKVRNRRSLGLNKRAKFILQFGVAILFGVLAITWVHTETTLSFTSATVPGIQLHTFLWIVLAVVMLTGTSNAVNLTDGLDGLAAGSATFCFAVLALIGYWSFRHFSIYHLGSALDLGLSSIALAGACLGFLWWNAAPARIYMGDTGSLSIGAGLAALCLLLNLDLLLIVIGGLFVFETLSVIAQVISFRIFHRRIFKMAPLHHHFELMGWPETTVIVRFWILAGIFAVVGLGIYYAGFLTASTGAL
jgi:phospho-N-acetylmuramoyl-pentapeptide-transferase